MLLAAGYLKHYTARAASGAFIHRYELMQEPSASAPHAFVTDADFVSGDCRIVLSGESKRDFTQIPNSILRSKRIPLAVKGLFGVVAHLINIPDFSLNPAGVRAFCMERIKRFSSIWRQLKLTVCSSSIVTRPARRTALSTNTNCSTSRIAKHRTS